MHRDRVIEVLTLEVDRLSERKIALEAALLALMREKRRETDEEAEAFMGLTEGAIENIEMALQPPSVPSEAFIDGLRGGLQEQIESANGELGEEIEERKRQAQVLDQWMRTGTVHEFHNTCRACGYTAKGGRGGPSPDWSIELVPAEP